MDNAPTRCNGAVAEAQTPPGDAPLSWPFAVVTAGFVTCLLLSNIISVKLVRVAGLIIPAATIIFPISYIIGDVLTEVYGYRRAKQVIWLGFALNLFAVLAIRAGALLPAAPFWDGQAAYERILGATPRLLAASFLAYLAGQFSNSYVMAMMKIATRGRWLWTRTIGSTLVGEGLDSAVFITAAFAGAIPAAALAPMIVSQWLLKTAYEAAATPLTYLVVGALKRKERE